MCEHDGSPPSRIEQRLSERLSYRNNVLTSYSRVLLAAYHAINKEARKRSCSPIYFIRRLRMDLNYIYKKETDENKKATHR